MAPATPTVDSSCSARAEFEMIYWFVKESLPAALIFPYSGGFHLFLSLGGPVAVIGNRVEVVFVQVQSILTELLLVVLALVVPIQPLDLLLLALVRLPREHTRGQHGGILLSERAVLSATARFLLLVGEDEETTLTDASGSLDGELALQVLQRCD